MDWDMRNLNKIFINHEDIFISFQKLDLSLEKLGKFSKHSDECLNILKKSQ